MSESPLNAMSEQQDSARSRTPTFLRNWLRDGVSPQYDPESVDWVETSDDFAIFLSQLSHSVHYQPDRWSVSTIEGLLQALPGALAQASSDARSRDRLSWKEAAAIILQAMGPPRRM